MPFTWQVAHCSEVCAPVSGKPVVVWSNDAGVHAVPEMPALPATFAIALPHRTHAAVATVATQHAAADLIVSSYFARGPPG